MRRNNMQKRIERIQLFENKAYREYADTNSVHTPEEVILANINKGRLPEAQEGWGELGFIETNIHNRQMNGLQDLFTKGNAYPTGAKELIKEAKEKNQGKTK